MKYLAKTFDLLLIGALFLGFFFYIIIESYNFFFRNKFFEGFQIVGMTLIFSFFSIPLLLTLLIKKEFENLKVLGLLVLIIFVLGFIGAKIPLTILPFVTIYAIIYIGKQLVKRNMELNKK